ncbi:MAG TPA: hypothetical protein VJ813_09685, partial [Vicinamibacterales bacterium]|nr:hypothetical protein [Vicinamibacterales bacterium]
MADEEDDQIPRTIDLSDEVEMAGADEDAGLEGAPDTEPAMGAGASPASPRGVGSRKASAGSRKTSGGRSR